MPGMYGWYQDSDTLRKVVAIIVAISLCFVLVVVLAYVGGEWLWWRLSNYVVPETPTERKDLVNVFVLIVGGAIAFLTASAAIGNLYMSRRNLYIQLDFADKRAQADALQAYYQQVGDLLTEHELREKEQGRRGTVACTGADTYGVEECGPYT